MGMRSHAVILLTGLLLLCSSAAIHAQPIPGAGQAIIVGGAWSSNENTIHTRINATRLPGKPLGVFGTASGTPASSGQSFVNTMVNKFGAGAAIYLDVTDSNGMADDEAMAALTRTCGGFFWVGGDQSRVTAAMYRGNGERTLVLDAVWEVYLAGGCVSGSSAGAAIMSDPMITGGTSASAVANGFRFGSGSGVNLGRGLGFFPGSQFDQHHLERGRLGRLVIATEGSQFARGYGIDENSALAINNNTGWGDSMGEMGLFVVDVSNMTIGPGRRRTGIRLHYLDFGSSIHMVTGEVAPRGNHAPITVPLYPAREISSTDVWGSYEAWRLVTELVDTEGATRAYGRDPAYDIWFRRIPETRAWRGPRHTYANTRYAYTITDVEMGIFPRGETFPPDEEHFAIF